MQILLIDDDALVLGAFKRRLRAHAVTATCSGGDALAIIQEGRTFDAILCDLRMPNMTGRDFYFALHQFAPQLAARVVFTSGGLCNPDDAAFVESHPTLMKPFTTEELTRALLPFCLLAPPPGTAWCGLEANGVGIGGASRAMRSSH